MAALIENEAKFVERATRFYGPSFPASLRTKGFDSPDFLFAWATVCRILGAQGIGPKVLDLGCGPGWTSIFLAGRGCQVTAVDVSSDMLAIARGNAERLGMAIDFQLRDIQADLPHGPFDAVTIFDALHHCADERKVLANSFQALRPGGKMLIVEPDWFHEYSPNSARDRKQFGTTERGLSFRRLRRGLRKVGFVDVRRYFGAYATSGRNPLGRIKAVLIALLTVTIGYPHRSVFMLAKKPDAAQ